jgi:hypothetical protein
MEELANYHLFVWYSHILLLFNRYITVSRSKGIHAQLTFLVCTLRNLGMYANVWYIDKYKLTLCYIDELIPRVAIIFRRKIQNNSVTLHSIVLNWLGNMHDLYRRKVKFQNGEFSSDV